MLARLHRLEQRQLRQPLKRRIVFAIADTVDADCVGMTSSCGKVHVPRRAGEPLEAFERRLAEIIPRFAFRCYSAPSNEPEAESWAEREVAPSAFKL